MKTLSKQLKKYLILISIDFNIMLLTTSRESKLINECTYGNESIDFKSLPQSL